jgi:hypothetical protein
MSRLHWLVFMMVCGVGSSCGGGAGSTAPEPPAKKGPESLIVFAPGPRPMPPAGCEWAINQTPMPGARVLLYMAAKCGGKSRTLVHTAKPEGSYFHSEEGSTVSVEMRPIANESGDAAILRHARAAMDAKTKSAACAVRPANDPNLPADAKVVDVSAAEAAKAPKDEPRTACGKYGLDEDAQVFWRAFQGFAWYFDLGQEQIEIDPGSLTIVTKDESGNWSLSKP